MDDTQIALMRLYHLMWSDVTTFESDQPDFVLLSVADDERINAACLDIEKLLADQPTSEPSAPSITRVIADVMNERRAQKNEWGERRDYPDGVGTPFWRRLAERETEARRRDFAAGRPNWSRIAMERAATAFSQRSPYRLRQELVRLAATVTAWIEAIDRRP